MRHYFSFLCCDEPLALSDKTLRLLVELCGGTVYTMYVNGTLRNVVRPFRIVSLLDRRFAYYVYLGNQYALDRNFYKTVLFETSQVSLL